jgi:hypothetical protein
MSSPEERRVMEEIGAGIRATVVEHGWAAVAVDADPPFMYTAGLWRLADHPELIITGLPNEPAKWVLDRAVALVREGKHLVAGTTVAGLIGDYPAAIRDVDPSRLSELAEAADLYRGVIYTALQIVWPDREGRFPWDRGAAREYCEAQPLLFVKRSSLLGRFGR